MANDFQVLGLDLITSIYPDQSNFKSDFWSEKKKKKKKVCATLASNFDHSFRLQSAHMKSLHTGNWTRGPSVHRSPEQEPMHEVMLQTCLINRNQMGLQYIIPPCIFASTLHISIISLHSINLHLPRRSFIMVAETRCHHSCLLQPGKPS